MPIDFNVNSNPLLFSCEVRLYSFSTIRRQNSSTLDRPSSVFFTPRNCLQLAPLPASEKKERRLSLLLLTSVPHFSFFFLSDRCRDEASMTAKREGGSLIGNSISGVGTWGWNKTDTSIRGRSARAEFSGSNEEEEAREALSPSFLFKRRKEKKARRPLTLSKCGRKDVNTGIDEKILQRVPNKKRTVLIVAEVRSLEWSGL